MSNRRSWLALAAVALSARTASAAPITGTLNITGTMRMLPTTAVDFLPAGGGAGDFTVTGVADQVGFFTALAGTTGDVGDLGAGDPIGAAFSRASWVTFDAAPLASFTLTFRDPGLYNSSDCSVAPAVGQSCTPAGSFLSLTNLPGGLSTLSFRVSGTGVGTAGELNPMTGLFATVVSTPYQTLLATLASGGSVDLSYSASFTVAEAPPTTPVPEPATAVLILVGAAGAVRRRFRRR